MIAASGIPGQGYMKIENYGVGVVNVLMFTQIRTRSITQSTLIEVGESLQLPFPNEDGVFQIKGQNVCLVRRARQPEVLDESGVRKPLKHVNELIIDSLEEIYAEIISDALKTALAPVRRGTGEFNRPLFETKLAAAFSSDKYARNLPPEYNKAECKAWMRTIILQNVLLDEKNPVPQGWEYVFDLTTTPQSEKVCTVYALARDASIENKRLVPGKELFCDIAIAGTFAPACAPTQMYKPWTTTRGHIKLQQSEMPFVNHETADPTLIQGINLRTVIVHDKYNQMDQLTVSESAARLLLGYVYTSEVVQVTSGGSELLVKIGQVVEPGDKIARVISADGESLLIARRIVHPAIVHNIESVERITNGIKGIQHRITLRSNAPLVSGDKLMPRSGCKGCVVIVPDEELPHIQQKDGSWVPTHIAVNPYPVAKRKNLSMLLEMACNEANIETIPINTNATLLKELYDKGYGHKKRAMRYGKELYFPIMSGDVFWMRSDSLKDYRTYGVSAVKKNFQNLNPDRGRTSGVSLNPTARLILSQAKGCPTLDRVLIEQNYNPAVATLVRQLYNMIDNSLKVDENAGLS